VQHRDAGDALVPPLPQVGLVGVQGGGGAGGQQLRGVSGAPEPAGQLLAQAQRRGGFGERAARGAQLVHPAVPLGDDRRQPGGQLPALLLSRGTFPGRRPVPAPVPLLVLVLVPLPLLVLVPLLVVVLVPLLVLVVVLVLVRVVAGAAGLGQAALVARDRPGRVLAQVVPQMPAVRDLDRLRGAVPDRLGIRPGPVPAHHLHLRVLLQPGRQRGGLPVRQHLHRPAGLHVHQQRRVPGPLTQREIIHPQHPH
jgi:hypothetical protein